MGGHFVQGHVDCTATLISRVPDGNAVTLRLAPARREALRYVVHKGFVAVDGASLTVTRVDDAEGWWEVMLIAYTQERVVTAAKEVGETVNLEVDMTAKYVEKSLQGYLEGLGEGSGGLLKKVLEGAAAGKGGAAA
jgi:riboflavin synthase